ncbi:hypothetical protein DSECCO2_384810 [anaerobic digester metagenome]
MGVHDLGLGVAGGDVVHLGATEHEVVEVARQERSALDPSVGSVHDDRVIKHLDGGTVHVHIGAGRVQTVQRVEGERVVVHLAFVGMRHVDHDVPHVVGEVYLAVHRVHGVVQQTILVAAGPHRGVLSPDTVVGLDPGGELGHIQTGYPQHGFESRYRVLGRGSLGRTTEVHEVTEDRRVVGQDLEQVGVADLVVLHAHIAVAQQYLDLVGKQYVVVYPASGLLAQYTRLHVQHYEVVIDAAHVGSAAVHTEVVQGDYVADDARGSALALHQYAVHRIGAHDQVVGDYCRGAIHVDTGPLIP